MVAEGDEDGGVEAGGGWEVVGADGDVGEHGGVLGGPYRFRGGSRGRPPREVDGEVGVGWPTHTMDFLTGNFLKSPPHKLERTRNFTERLAARDLAANTILAHHLLCLKITLYFKLIIFDLIFDNTYG